MLLQGMPRHGSTPKLKRSSSTQGQQPRPPSSAKPLSLSSSPRMGASYPPPLRSPRLLVRAATPSAPPADTNDASLLIIRREALIKQLLDFATKWSQAAAPTKAATAKMVSVQARHNANVDALASSLLSIRKHEPPPPVPAAAVDGASARPALKAVEAARGVATRMLFELSDVTLRLIEALVIDRHKAVARYETKKKASAERRAVLARLGGADDSSSDSEDDDPPTRPAFKRGNVAWAVAHAADAIAAPPGVSVGLDYLLRVLLDFHRLPLPSATDPFLLRWFDDEARYDARWSEAASSLAYGAARRRRMEAAEAALHALLSARQHEAVRLGEKSSVGRSSAGWRALALLLYGSTGGFTLRQRELWERRQAAVRLQVMTRRWKLRGKVAARRRARLEAAAIRIQRAFRRTMPSLGAVAGGVGEKISRSNLQRRREEARLARQRERELVEQRREQRRREERARVLRRRRRALRTALPEARQFLKALSTVERAFRAGMARKLLMRSRLKRATATLAATPAAARAAAVWQSRYRSWSLRAELVEREHALCLRAYGQQAAEARLAPMVAWLPGRWGALRGQHAEARGRLQAAAAKGTDGALLSPLLSAEREAKAAEGRLRLLEAVRHAIQEAEKTHGKGGDGGGGGGGGEGEGEGEGGSDDDDGGGVAVPINRALVDECAAKVVAEAHDDAAAEATGTAGTADAAELAGTSSEAQEDGGGATLQPSGLSEVEGGLMRLRELSAWVSTLGGAAKTVDELEAADESGEWATQELRVQSMHILATSDIWAQQRDGAEAQLSALRRRWQRAEFVAAAERAAATLRDEAAIYLPVDADADSDDDDDTSFSKGGAQPGSSATTSPPERRSGTRARGGGGSTEGGAGGGSRVSEEASAKLAAAAVGSGGAGGALPPERLAELLDAARADEARARGRAAEADEVNREWAAAMDEVAQLEGEMRVVAALDAAAARNDERNKGLHRRELRAERLASNVVKLERRRVQHTLWQSRGGAAALQQLLLAGVTATSGATFSARKMLGAHVEHAEAALRQARLDLAEVARAKREARATARRQFDRSASALDDGESGAGGGGGGGGADDEKRAAKEKETCREAIGRAEGALRELRALKERDTGKGPPLAEALRAQLDACAAAEKRGAAQIAELEARMSRRAAAKHRLRSLAVIVGAAAKAAAAGLADADADAPSSLERAGLGSSLSGAVRHAPASAAADGGGGSGEVANCRETERQWELRHVHVAVAGGAARLNAERGGVQLFGWSTLSAALQMQPQAWLAGGGSSGGGAVLGVAHMRAAAEALQISLDRSEGQYTLLWVATQLLRAPLPAGWATVAPAAGKILPRFRDTRVGGAEQDEHPLMSTFVDELDIMRRRLRLRYRAHRSVESMWLFARPDGPSTGPDGGAGVYYDLTQGPSAKGMDAFPASRLPAKPTADGNGGGGGGDGGDDGPDGGGSGRSGSTLFGQGGRESGRASGSGLMAAIQQQRINEEAKQREVRRKECKAAAAEAELRSRPLRWAALRAAPICCVELVYAARALGVDLREQPELAFLAEMALCTPLPAGWEAQRDAAGKTSYRNTITNVTVAKHPLQLYAASFTP